MYMIPLVLGVSVMGPRSRPRVTRVHATHRRHDKKNAQAVAVAQTAINEKLARNLTPADLPFLEGIIQRRMYDPVYVPLIPMT